MLILCILLSLLSCGLGLWAWTQRKALRAAAAQLAEQSRGDSDARVRLAVPNRSAEALLEQVNRLLELRRQDQSRWREREQSLRRQIANVSHDLRTPLTSILGYLQLLEDEDLGEEERLEYLEVVESRARALQSLITGFYDLSRLEGGEFPLNREPVNLYASLSGLLAAFYGDFTEKGFDMTVELEERLPPVLADSGGVLRVFTNLIRNALDHGKGKMTVKLYREGDGVVSLFANQTDELTEEDLPRVFDRFFTSDKMRTGRNTGLGLAIVKALAEQMGCRVEAGLRDGFFSIAIQWVYAK
ncbi:HAMP domain-containing histidine kinase [Pseudoflavonifractor phocaeensis]|nr:HAMP domain-containing histidine kinase [Pseudoflavonifractor phocaeensis]